MQDFDPQAFSGTTRLFPLGGVVLYPHAVLPLHIFEPRYRQMMNDALLSDKLITIIQSRHPILETPQGPALESVGCLGQVIMHERLPDGRYNLLLAGMKRVRLLEEIRTPGKLYREARVTILEDEASDAVRPSCVKELSTRFLALLARHDSGDPMGAALRKAIEERTDNGVLADLVAQALTLPRDLKQAMLEEPRVPHRVDALLNILRPLTTEIADEDDDRADFPPRFSLN